MSQVKHTPGPLHVEPEGLCTRQFAIRSDFHRRPGEWDDVYVEFSGYFGSYGPHLFAAAPELSELVRRGRQKLATYVGIYPGDKELQSLLRDWDSALARAEGCA